MKLSKIKQIIKEEVAKVFSEVDKNQRLNDKFAAAVGFTPPAPGGPENKLRSNDTKKLYTFEYVFWYGKSPDPDYSFEFVTVEASNEQEARDLAYDEARKEHRSLRSSKEKFDLVSVEDLD